MEENNKQPLKEKLKELNSKQIKKPHYTKKERVLISALVAFAFSFIFMFFGPIDIFANNMQELGFAFSDIVLPIFGVFILSFVGITFLLYITNIYVMNMLSSIIVSFIISCYVNNLFISNVKFVSGDVTNTTSRESNAFFTVFILLFFVLIITFYVVSKFWKKMICFLCVLLICMNSASLISDCINTNMIKVNNTMCDYVLSEKDMFKVAKKDNIILILFDRFDTTFYDEVIAEDPTFFDSMDGFTYFDSATSVYSRTFPAVTSLLTGVEYEGDCTPSEYFETAYSKAPFLNDLKNSGYDINLYCHKYYTYSDAKVMKGLVNNVEKVSGYSVNKAKTLNYLLQLSFGRNYNLILRYLMYVNGTSATTSLLTNIESENTTFVSGDAAIFQKLTKNKLSYGDSDKRFTFLYLQGCHSPFILDKDGQVSDNATSVSQTEGSFLIIKDYIKYLKEIGAYDNSTIIITGDHAKPDSDWDGITETASKGKTTSIWVKPKNSTSKGYVTSHAPVSVANIEATFIKDGKVKTNNDYGKSILDIKEGDNVTRIHHQSIYNKNTRKLNFYQYTIVGDAKDIKNWSLKEKFDSDIPWY